MRIGAEQACSGVVVSPRFVLSSKRCVSRNGSLLGASRLAVVAKGRLGDQQRIAGVRTRSRGSDLVLLQLVSATASPPARLIAAKRNLTRAGRPVTVVGWSSPKKLQAARGRFVPTTRCGTRSKNTLCAGLPRGSAVPAARCADASGTSLQLSALGRRYVAGIGARGGRGCRRPARLRFTRLDTESLRWVVTTIHGSGAQLGFTASGGPDGSPTTTTTTPLIEPTGEPGAPAAGGTTPGNPAPGSGGPLAPYLGTWAGVIEQQPSGGRYNATIRITRDGAVGEVVGTSEYATRIACGGDLLFGGSSAETGVRFDERLTFGQSGCIGSGRITLALVSGAPRISYTWRREATSSRSDGVLSRTG